MSPTATKAVEELTRMYRELPSWPSVEHVEAAVAVLALADVEATWLDEPLNYIYLADLLPHSVSRVLYLDSDLLVVEDIRARFPSVILSGVHRRGEGCGAPVEPARTQRGQRGGSSARIVLAAAAAAGALGDDGMQEWTHQAGLAEDVAKLESEMKSVQILVAAAEGRRIDSTPLSDSLHELKELLYDAEDVMDELDYYRLQQHI
ncbi:hypothetical protein ABZP36_030451 [Zizania latifolia]